MPITPDDSQTIGESAEAATQEAGAEMQSILARLLDVVSTIRDTVSKTVANAGDATIKAEDKVEQLYTDTVEIIEREPVISAALAFGIGCLAGYLVFASRNSGAAQRVRGRY
jgi:ElaB/YqjD/DUF883 family membrane-anchored ribosome-binding protein